MKRECMAFSIALVFLFVSSGVAASLDMKYHTSEEIDTLLTAVARAYPDLVQVDSMAESIEGRDIWMIQVGRGKQAEQAARPAMLVVAGLEGDHLVGTELVLAFLDRLAPTSPSEASNGTHRRPLLQSDDVNALLDSVTVYLVPRLNPDGAERYFMKPRAEQRSTLKPTDDDHDGMIDEDGPDDLNGDGLITWVRIEDPEGEYVEAEKDARILRKAKRDKGERGTWRLIVEGHDEDGDDAFNEDGVGGVNLNMNFPFNYAFFDAASGIHQVSEPETRGLADFVVAHPNIALVFTFSSADNLLAPPDAEKEESNETGGDRRVRKPATKINAKDIAYFKVLGEEYRDVLGLSKELTGASVDGSFADWMYFHRGRMSLAAQGWNPAMQLALEKKASDGDKKEKEEEKEEDEEDEEDDNKEEDKTTKQQRELLEWLEEDYPEGFVSWTAIEHPDFEGQKVEVGGFAPYVQTNPPPSRLEELGKQHATFLTELAGKLPRIAFRKHEATHLGGGVFEIEVEIENNGYLPTVLAHGANTREVAPTRVKIDMDPEMILAGDRIARIEPIAGSGGVQKVRWIVRRARKTSVTVRVVSALGGSIEETIILKN